MVKSNPGLLQPRFPNFPLVPVLVWVCAKRVDIARGKDIHTRCYCVIARRYGVVDKNYAFGEANAELICFPRVTFCGPWIVCSICDTRSSVQNPEQLKPSEGPF